MGERQQQPISFVPDQQSGWSVRAGASPLTTNVVIDGRGAVRRRPGITAYANFPLEDNGLPTQLGNATEIQGLWVALNGDLYAIDSQLPARHIHLVTTSPSPTNRDLSVDSITGDLILTRALVGTGRPVFAETEAALWIAGGDEPEKIKLSDAMPSRAGGFAGNPRSTHIIANASRLLINGTGPDAAAAALQGGFLASAPGAGAPNIPPGHENWDTAAGAAFVSAEARPDKVIALFENTNEVFVFGDTTLQVFGTDPQFVYSPLPTKNHGLAGPYAAIEVDQKIAFLDHRRRFCISDGRSLDYIGEPIQATLDDMETVTDVFGFRVRTNILDCLCWQFPTDGRTFVYQINTKGPAWSLWMGWDGRTNNWKRLRVRSHTHRHATGDNLVGLDDGRVGILSMDASTDFGEAINAYIETGFEDRGTDLKKHCVAVHIALKRGEIGANEATPVAWLKWRDDAGAWTGKAPISLGASGDREIVVTLRSLGVYRRRQWLFEFAGSADLELTRATEIFEVLSN